MLHDAILPCHYTSNSPCLQAVYHCHLLYYQVAKGTAHRKMCRRRTCRRGEHTIWRPLKRRLQTRRGDSCGNRGKRTSSNVTWPRRTLPAEDLYLSHSVFPFETTIFLERFPLERERFLIFPSCPSALSRALCAPSRALAISSKRRRNEA